MRGLVQPTFAVGAVAPACAKAIANESLAGRLAAVITELVSAETAFIADAPKGALFKTAPATHVGGQVSVTEMTSIYDDIFARKGSSVRKLFYDIIKMAPPHRICPYCAHRTVGSLDHYLAKAKHPVLALTPANLVPACNDCNRAKSSKNPASANKQWIHPYFENVDDQVWLKAEIEQGSPPGVVFRVDPPAAWPDVTNARVLNQFKELELGALYSSQAAALIADLSLQLNRLRERAGPDAVKAHLEETALSHRRVRNNSWQIAALTAMSQSAYFCAHEFVL